MNWEELFLPHILKRGERYFKEGRVIGLARKGKTYSAYVDGSGSTYRVSVLLNQDGLTQADCSCPYAQSGMYCKHMAAVLYALEPKKAESGAVVLPILKIPEKEILRFTTKAAYQRDQNFMYNQRLEVKRLPNGMYWLEGEWGFLLRQETEFQDVLLNSDFSINNFSCTCNEEQMLSAKKFCLHLNALMAAVNSKNMLLKTISLLKSDFPLPECHLLPVPPEEMAAEKEVRLTKQKYQYYAALTASYCDDFMEMPGLPPLFQIEPPEEGNVELQAYFMYEDDENDEDLVSQPVLYFKIGMNFFYKIKNLLHFLNRVEEGEFYRYGQKLAFAHKRSAFTEETWRLIGILRQYKPLMLSSGSLPLEKTSPIMDELFDFFSENPDFLHDLTLEESERNPDLRIQPLEHGFYQLNYSGLKPPLFFTEQYAYRITGRIWERFVMPDAAATEELMALIRYTYPHVVFKEELRPVVQALVDRANGDPETDEDPLAFKLDLEKDSIRIEIEGGNRSKLAGRLIEALELSGCFLKNGAYHFSGVDQQWLNELTRELENYGEVWVSEELKAYHKVYRVTPMLHVRQKGSILKLNIEFNDIEAKEIAAILRSFRRKREYHKLKNGETIKLDLASWQELSDFAENQNILPEELAGGEVELPMQQLFSLAAEKLPVHFDGDVQAIRQKFEEHRMTDFVLPAAAQKLLKPYQIEGVQFLKLLESLNLNGILADDMGLGKTLQTLTILAEQQDKPSLVICPASLIYNWRDEAARFFPEMKVACVLGTKEERERLWQAAGEYQLLVTGYDYLLRDLPELRAMSFYYVILDESQRIKNMQTKSAKAAKLLTSEHRLALSGTPIENNLAELWSVFDFLMPGYLYSYARFRKKLELPIVRGEQSEAAARLKALTSPFILRRLKKDVLTDLPEKVEKVFTVELSAEERRVYAALEASVSRTIRSMLGENGGEIGVEVLALLTRLRLMCCDRSLAEEGVAQTGSKVKACIRLVLELMGQNQQILIFSSFTKVLELLAAELDRLHLSYRILRGSTPKEERHQAVQDFQAGRFGVFLISLKAGGTGLNLTEAQAVIHFDPWWNKAAMNQATDRAYRIGQRQSVSVYSMIVADSIEERIFELQNKKWSLAEQFIDGDGKALKKLSVEEFMELFERK